MSPGPLHRLSARTYLSAHASGLPTYDRSPLPCITHLGVGAFSRAHLGVYADDLLRRGWPALIRGVSIRSRRVADQMVPQDGLYSVSEREPGSEVVVRLIGSMTRVTTGVEAAVHAVSASTTKVVTLTVSEKGYEVDPGELLNPRRPTSAPGVIARSLDLRRRSGSAAPLVVALDNVLGNGHVLRRCVLEVAEHLDAHLPQWIADEVRFPNSVVDRLVPATTERDLEMVQAQLGLVDLAAVVSERHRSWVIESVDGLPPLAEVGVQIVDSITPFERRKLWLLNGPHSALAYCGLLAGCTTIASAAEHPAISIFVRELVTETLQVADLPASVEPERFAVETLERFRNPSLGHTCAQVGADGSRKLPQRLVPIAAVRRQRNLDTTKFATVIALWLAAVAGIRIQGRTVPSIDDPAAEALRVAAKRGGLRQLSQVALGEHCEAQFVHEVAVALDDLTRFGMMVIGTGR